MRIQVPKEAPTSQLKRALINEVEYHRKVLALSRRIMQKHGPAVHQIVMAHGLSGSYGALTVSHAYHSHERGARLLEGLGIRGSVQEKIDILKEFNSFADTIDDMVRLRQKRRADNRVSEPSMSQRLDLVRDHAKLVAMENWKLPACASITFEYVNSSDTGVDHETAKDYNDSLCKYRTTYRVCRDWLSTVYRSDLFAPKHNYLVLRAYDMGRVGGVDLWKVHVARRTGTWDVTDQIMTLGRRDGYTILSANPRSIPGLIDKAIARDTLARMNELMGV